MRDQEACLPGAAALQVHRIKAPSYVPAARAVADTARGLTALAEVRAVVADAVQRRRVQPWHLGEEVAPGPARGARGIRMVLAEIADGVRSVAEADLRTLIVRDACAFRYTTRACSRVRHSSPRPTPGGLRRASPARSNPASGICCRPDWERTLARAARMSAFGIVVLPLSPRRLRTEPPKVAAEIRSALEAGRDRSGHGIRALAAN
jgi:hypothetical protein